MNSAYCNTKTGKVQTIENLLKGNTYPGRGIIIGKSSDGINAVTAYFIMGRSNNSRNRILAIENGALYTKPFDISKVEDPSLIIYRAADVFQNRLIITNGDQTDTILNGFKQKTGSRQSLQQRTYEPDAPNFTPRISGVLTFRDGDFSYEMSILKKKEGSDMSCDRIFHDYAACPGIGHVIHTYKENGNPLPSFEGEPAGISIPDDMEEFGNTVWNALDEENRISLYVRYTNVRDMSFKDLIINKNK